MFDPSSVHVEFVLDKMPMVQPFLRVFPFSPVSTIPPMVHTHFHLHVTLTKRTKERSVGTLRQARFFHNREALDRKLVPLFFQALEV
jgi:hypothetical protein